MRENTETVWRQWLFRALTIAIIVYVVAVSAHLASVQLAVRRNALRTLTSETQSQARLVAMFLGERRAEVRSLVDSGVIQQECRGGRSGGDLDTIARLLGRFGDDHRVGDMPAFSALIFISAEGAFRSVPVTAARPVGLTLGALRAMLENLYVRPAFLTHRTEDGQVCILLSAALVSEGTVHGQLLAVLNADLLDHRLGDAPTAGRRNCYLLTSSGEVYTPSQSPGDLQAAIAAMVEAGTDAPVHLEQGRPDGRRDASTLLAVRTAMPATEFSLVAVERAARIPSIGSTVRLAGAYAATGLILLAVMLFGPLWRDLPAQTRRQREAGEAHLFGLLFDHLPDGVAVVQSNGVVGSANHGFAKQVGLDLQEIEGKPLRSLLGEIVDDGERGPLNRALQGRQTWLGCLRSRRPNGGQLVTETLIVPIRGMHAEFQGLLVVQRDTTARTLLEERLRQAQKMEAVGVLSDGIAHDFNNLLTVIQGNCNLLLYGASTLDAYARDNIDEIIRACDRAASMTRRLLAFSRHKEIQMQVMDLNEVVGRTEKMLARLIRENVEMTVHLAPTPVLVRADPVQIDQVVINLTVNARDAMPRGGRLTIRVSRQSLAARSPQLQLAEGDYAVLSVEDTGHGMDEATRRRIFEPFFTTKGEREGTGLGLTTVVTVVKEHGGDLCVQSELGVGSTFTVYLPVYREAACESPVEPAADSLHAPAQFLPLRGALPEDASRPAILVLDDEDSVLRMIERALKAYGYRVHAARTDIELLVLWEQHQNEVGLLITDMVMPGMSGVEVAERLRQDVPALKVLNISAYTDTVIMRLGGGEQEDTLFLQKPFTPDMLIAMVDELLGEASSPPAGGAELQAPIGVAPEAEPVDPMLADPEDTAGPAMKTARLTIPPALRGK